MLFVHSCLPESKTITVYLRLTSHLLPNASWAWARSHDPPAEGEELGIAVGTLNVLRYHRLSDLELLVSNALEQFSQCLDSVRGQGSASSSSGCGLDDPYLNLSDRILKRYKMAKLFIQPSPMSGSGLKDETMEEEEYETGMENGNGDEIPGMENGNVDRASYLDYCRGILREFHSHTEKLDLDRGSIASYSIGELSWEAGHLPKRLMSKSLFNLLGECKARTSSVSITLKGKIHAA